METCEQMEENGIKWNRAKQSGVEYDLIYFDVIKYDLFKLSFQTDSVCFLLTSMIQFPFNSVRKPMQQVVSELASEQRLCPKGQVTMSRAQRFYERQHAWLQAGAIMGSDGTNEEAGKAALIV